MKFYINKDFTGGVLPNNIVYLNAKDESGKDFLVYYHAPFDNNEHAFKLLTDLSSGELDLPDYRKNDEEMQNWTTDINSIYENYINGDLESSPEEDDSRVMDEFAKSESNKAFEGMFGITRERYEEIAKAQDLKMYTMGVLSDVQESINDRTQEQRLNLVKLIIDTQLENKQVINYLSVDKKIVQVDKNNKLLLTTEHFNVVISQSEKHGSFEHVGFGEEYGGGLWFDDNKELDDFDGVSVLPEEVADAIIQLGYKVDKEQFCDISTDDVDAISENDSRVQAALTLKEKINKISNVLSLAGEHILMSKDLLNRTSKVYMDADDLKKIASYDSKNLASSLAEDGFSDYIIVDGFVYSMEEYDYAGKEIRYVSLDANKRLLIETDDRYGSIEDIEISFEDGIDHVRNDISYATATKPDTNQDDNSTSQNSNSVRKNR